MNAAAVGAEDGQASLEVVAAVPFVLVAAILCLQLLAAGYSLTIADGAVEAGALALAAGREPRAAVESSLPGWARGRVDLDASGGRLTLHLRPPSPIDAVSRALEVSSTVWVRRAVEGSG